jgi:putative ABC transport system permease protein
MKTPLAWLNLLHNKARTVVALSGVAFAVLLVFMQLGFLGAIETTGIVIYDALEFDVLLRSKEYLHLVQARSFPRTRLYQAAALTGVTAARPLYLGLNLWRNPHNGQRRLVLVMGIKPEDSAFKLPEIRRQLWLLVAPELLLIDRKSRPEFGPANGRRFSDADVGVETEVSGKRVRIAGHFGLGFGFAGDGGILLNESGFVRLVPGRTPEDVSLGLLTLAPGADPAEVAARLRKRLPPDVDVLTRQEALDYETRRWVHETSVGTIFQLGVAVSLFVGMAIVYQVLSSDVADHMGEYATLKAMGYRDHFLAGVVLRQAVALGVVGFLPGLALATLLYELTSRFANIPIEMNGQRMAVVLGLSLAMCVISALGAIRKIRSVDPAELF